MFFLSNFSEKRGRLVAEFLIFDDEMTCFNGRTKNQQPDVVTFAVDFSSVPQKKTSMDGSNGDAAAGGPNPAGGDGPGQGGVALLSDPVDVIIDKLLR